MGVIFLKRNLMVSRHVGTYLSKRMVRLARSDWTSRVSSQLLTYGFQPKSAALMKRIPARDTVAGVAVFKWLISKRSLMEGVSGMRSLLASVKTWKNREKSNIDQLRVVSKSAINKSISDTRCVPQRFLFITCFHSISRVGFGVINYFLVFCFF